jgi:cold shock CspA family protein
MARGKVVAFDEHRGLGELEDDDGSRLPFHCTAIADGSRTIAVDASVEFDLAPGPLGRWEATEIIPA